MTEFLMRSCALIFVICCAALGVGIGKALHGEDMTEYFANPIGHTFQMFVEIWNAC